MAFLPPKSNPPHNQARLTFALIVGRSLLPVWTNLFSAHKTTTIFLTTHKSKWTMIRFFQMFTYVGWALHTATIISLFAPPSGVFLLLSLVHHRNSLLFHLHYRQIMLDSSALLLVYTGYSHSLLLMWQPRHMRSLQSASVFTPTLRDNLHLLTNNKAMSSEPLVHKNTPISILDTNWSPTIKE